MQIETVIAVIVQCVICSAHALVICSVFTLYSAFMPPFNHPVVNVKFSQQNYTVREGNEAVLKIELDRRSERPISFDVTTMSITADRE